MIHSSVAFRNCQRSQACLGALHAVSGFLAIAPTGDRCLGPTNATAGGTAHLGQNIGLKTDAEVSKQPRGPLAGVADVPMPALADEVKVGVSGVAHPVSVPAMFSFGQGESP